MTVLTDDIVESDIEVGDVRTRSLAVEGEGPTILLLHGWTDSADCWRPLLGELAARSRRAIAVDLPGHGRADPLSRGSVLPGFDQFAKAFVDAHTDGAPVVLAGNSLGGMLALRAAASPDLELAAIAPISPAGLAYHDRFVRIMGTGVLLAPILRLIYRIPVAPQLVRLAASQLYEKRFVEGRADPELARLYAQHIRGMGDIRRNGAIGRAIQEESLVDPIRLEQIRTRVLLIWGGRDRLCDIAGAQLVLDAVPSSELVTLKDCGHCPQLHRPKELAQLLAKLPDSLSA